METCEGHILRSDLGNRCYMQFCFFPKIQIRFAVVHPVKRQLKRMVYLGKLYIPSSLEDFCHGTVEPPKN